MEVINLKPVPTVMIRNQSGGAWELGVWGGGQGAPQRGVHLTTCPLASRDSNRSAPRVQVAGLAKTEVHREEAETTTTRINNSIKVRVSTKMTRGIIKTGIMGTGIITEIKNRITGTIDRIVTKRTVVTRTTGGIKKIKGIIKGIKGDRGRIIKMTMITVIGNHTMIETHIKTTEIEEIIIMKIPGTRIVGITMRKGRTFPMGKDRVQAGAMGIKDIKRTMMRGGQEVTGVKVMGVRGVGKVKDIMRTKNMSQGQKGLVLPRVADTRTPNHNHIKLPIRIKVNLKVKDSLKVKVTSQNL